MSVSHCVFCRSLPMMSNSLRDDETLPYAQVIVHVVDRIDTPLFARPIRQRTTTQQRLFRGDESNSEVVKFDAPFINSGIVSYSHCRKVIFPLNPFISQVQMQEFPLVNVFLNLTQAHGGIIGRHCLVTLRDLIPSSID